MQRVCGDDVRVDRERKRISREPRLRTRTHRARSTAYGALIESEPAHNDAALEALWAREMLTGYTARRGSAFRQSRGTEALAFVVDMHLQFAGHLSMAQQAALVDKARGELGSNLEYVGKPPPS